MLGLPKSTEFNKRIPKQKFYENIAVTPAMKKSVRGADKDHLLAQ